MTIRDEQLVELRPSITVEGSAVSAAEIFQNQTLRPILKLQNELLLAAFQHYAEKRKGQFYKLSKSKQQEYIEHSVRKDLKFKNRLLGMIIGHFTQEEWATFLTQESEFTKRITTMLIERFQTQLEQLTAVE